MIQKILIPFVYGVKSADNAETRSRLAILVDYIARHRFDGDYLVLLSGGITKPSLARQLLTILRSMGCKLPDHRFIYEENSWDTTKQIKNMVPIIKSFSPRPQALVFSNILHLARIKIVFSRYGIKIKLMPSKLGFESKLYTLIYILIYEPLMFFATVFGLDNLISRLTRDRLKSTS